MPESIEIFLQLLGQFTGTGGGAQHPIVQFGLAAFFWSVLLTVVVARRREHQEPHEAWLVWAFSIALARELLMVGVKVVEAYRVLSPQELHVFFPPAEHALSNIALVIVAAAFMMYLTRKTVFAKWYLVLSVISVIAVYLGTFLWWADFITQNPESKFGQTWCDWAFRINASVWLAIPIIHLWNRVDGWTRNVVCSALGLFFLNEFLKIPDMALGEHYEYVFAPIRHAFYIAAIPLLGYVYIKELAIELKNVLGTLEQKVDERTIELKKALAELETANERLTEAARTDSLTGVANRRRFLEAADDEWQRAKRTGSQVSALMIDADNFKTVNDRHGHSIGDQVLVKLAKAISLECRRDIDTIARYGGEEFVALLPMTGPVGAVEVAESIRRRIKRMGMSNDGQQIPVSVSIGVANTFPSSHKSIDWLLDKADEALYKAKHGGRDRVCVIPESEKDKLAL